MCTCPHCGRQFKSRPGFQSHRRACANRPTIAQLLEDIQNHLTLHHLAHRYDVNRYTISHWLKQPEIQIGPRGRHADNLTMYPELAPLYKRYALNCRKCPALVYCQKLVNKPGWVLCEAADDAQLNIWRARGIDVQTIVAELQRVVPELWSAPLAQSMPSTSHNT